MHNTKILLQFFLLLQCFSALSMEIGTNIDERSNRSQKSVTFCPDIFCPDTFILDRKIRESLIPEKASTQKHDPSRWVKPQPGQESLVQAINTGDMKLFYSCMQRGDNCLDCNPQGYNPVDYVTRKLCRVRGLQIIDNKEYTHKEMFKILTILKIKSDYGV